MKKLDKLFDMCNRNVPYINVGEDVSYCFLEDKKTLYIFFEPSNGEVDWKHNFMFSARPYHDMQIPYRVHRGFLKCWKYVENIVIKKITEIDDNGKFCWNKIIVVGYSHGGALSMFAMECCWYYRPDIRDKIYGVGFDSPRVYAGFTVKKELQERWKQYIVFRNHTDIVTHVPPALFGYCHVGTVIQIGNDLKINSVESHYPEHILAALKAFEEETGIKYIEDFFKETKE